MIPIPNGVRVWLATGHTDMRKGFESLALVAQESLKCNPYDGDLFILRGRRDDVIKIVWHDGQGACLFLHPYSGPTIHELQLSLDGDSDPGATREIP